MAKYKLQPDGVLDRETGGFISENVENADWRAFIAWQEAGNRADPWKNEAELLADAKEERQMLVEASLSQALARGMETSPGSGQFIQIRPEDTANVTAAVLRATLAAQVGGWPSDFSWILADNRRLAIATPQEMVRIGDLVFAEVSRLRLSARSKKDMIAAAPDGQTLSQIPAEIK